MASMHRGRFPPDLLPVQPDPEFKREVTRDEASRLTILHIRVFVISGVLKAEGRYIVLRLDLHECAGAVVSSSLSGSSAFAAAFMHAADFHAPLMIAA